jgi:hypothetical protein
MENPDYADLLYDFIGVLMGGYWDHIGVHLPPEMPEIVSRVSYDMEWPADPWSPVKIDESSEVIEY